VISLLRPERKPKATSEGQQNQEKERKTKPKPTTTTTQPPNPKPHQTTRTRTLTHLAQGRHKLFGVLGAAGTMSVNTHLVFQTKKSHGGETSGECLSCRVAGKCAPYAAGTCRVTRRPASDMATLVDQRAMSSRAVLPGLKATTALRPALHPVVRHVQCSRWKRPAACSSSQSRRARGSLQHAGRPSQWRRFPSKTRAKPRPFAAACETRSTCPYPRVAPLGVPTPTTTRRRMLRACAKATVRAGGALRPPCVGLDPGSCCMSAIVVLILCFEGT
jgi:hypothetical protein